MKLNDLFDNLEEAIIDLLARVDEGDEEALEELKKVKIYLTDLAEVLSVIDDEDTIQDFQKKMDKLSKKFDEFLMDVIKVTG